LVHSMGLRAGLARGQRHAPGLDHEGVFGPSLAPSHRAGASFSPRRARPAHWPNRPPRGSNRSLLCRAAGPIGGGGSHPIPPAVATGSSACAGASRNSPARRGSPPTGCPA
jgi:hypothetical protein